MAAGQATYREVVGRELRRAQKISALLAFGGILVLIAGLVLDNGWTGSLTAMSLLMLIASGVTPSLARICCSKCSGSLKDFVMPRSLHLPGGPIVERRPVPIDFCPNCGVDLDSEVEFISSHSKITNTKAFGIPPVKRAPAGKTRGGIYVAGLLILLVLLGLSQYMFRGQWWMVPGLALGLAAIYFLIQSASRNVGQVCSECGFKIETGRRATFCPGCGKSIDSLGGSVRK